MARDVWDVQLSHLSDDTNMLSSFVAPSVTSFRSQIREVMIAESGTGHTPRHITILGLDGISYAIAQKRWRRATTFPMRAVHPTTSSTGWLSSLTGLSVDSHGIPGVVFKVSSSDRYTINVFQSKADLFHEHFENIFSDGAKCGYMPVALAGDLIDYDCTWRSQLLNHAKALFSPRLWTRYELNEPFDVTNICSEVRCAILALLSSSSTTRPLLIWFFLDCDRYIHYHGYDHNIISFLDQVEELAFELSSVGSIVVAHSDHGLTPTFNSPSIQGNLDELCSTHGCFLGGAGRMRWLYCRPDQENRLLEEVAQILPPSISVSCAGAIFSPRSRSHARAGAIVMRASGSEFITSLSYNFDHGSGTDAEVYVPMSLWH